MALVFDFHAGQPPILDRTIRRLGNHGRHQGDSNESRLYRAATPGDLTLGSPRAIARNYFDDDPELQTSAVARRYSRFMEHSLRYFCTAGFFAGPTSGAGCVQVIG